MASYQIRWARSARDDLLEVLAYLVEHASVTVASAFLDQIESASDTLTVHPNRGSRVREVEVPELRQLIIGEYRLIYRVEEGAVGIVRLIHGRRDLSSAMKSRR